MMFTLKPGGDLGGKILASKGLLSMTGLWEGRERWRGGSFKSLVSQGFALFWLWKDWDFIHGERGINAHEKGFFDLGSL